MVTVSHLVKEYVNKHPFIAEALSRNIISHPGLAEEILPQFQKYLGKKVTLPAIVMALRRHSENIQAKSAPKKITSKIMLRSDVALVLFHKPGIIKEVVSGKSIISVTKGLNYTTAIIDANFKSDYVKIGKIIEDLVCITIIFSKEYSATSGVLFGVTRNLAWNNINIMELVSAGDELSIIVKKVDSIRAVESLEEFFK